MPKFSCNLIWNISEILNEENVFKFELINLSELF